MDITNYIKPELLPVAIACYFAGMALKNTTIIKDKWIPFVLGTLSVSYTHLTNTGTAAVGYVFGGESHSYSDVYIAVSYTHLLQL